MEEINKLRCVHVQMDCKYHIALLWQLRLALDSLTAGTEPDCTSESSDNIGPNKGSVFDFEAL